MLNYFVVKHNLRMQVNLMTILCCQSDLFTFSVLLFRQINIGKYKKLKTGVWKQKKIRKNVAMKTLTTRLSKFYFYFFISIYCCFRYRKVIQLNNLVRDLRIILVTMFKICKISLFDKCSDVCSLTEWHEKWA